METFCMFQLPSAREAEMHSYDFRLPVLFRPDCREKENMSLTSVVSTRGFAALSSFNSMGIWMCVNGGVKQLCYTSICF